MQVSNLISRMHARVARMKTTPGLALSDFADFSDIDTSMFLIGESNAMRFALCPPSHVKLT